MEGNTINSDVTMGGAEATLLVNRYRVVRQLGQGGMGSVWLAEDTQLDHRQVAIKMLPSVLVSNKRAYQQLKSEALVSLKLTHPNIATVRAFEENNGNPFLVVDYIDGITLDDYLLEKCDTGRAASMRPPHVDAKDKTPVDAIVSIASDQSDPSSSDAFETNASTGAAPHPGGLPESEVIRLLTPIAAALDYAHSKGVVHRDVKPGNVMIAKDGTPYILDFGIAREIQETMTHVTGKLSSGTLMYMSPEQLHGAAPKASQDVYSFAAMAYECLMGTPPFSRGQIEYQIEHDSPAPLAPHFMKCGQGVMAGLAKRPEDRPANCAAVLIESSEPAPTVSSWMGWNARSISEKLTSPTAQSNGYSRTSNRNRLLGIACPFLVFLVGLTFFWIMLQRNTNSTDAQMDAGISRRNAVQKSELGEESGQRVHDKDARQCNGGLKNGDMKFKEHEQSFGATLSVQNEDVGEFEQCRRNAAQGDAVAQCKLGVMYLTGVGVAQNLVEARKWFMRARGKSTDADCYLAWMWENGIGGAKDKFMAELLYAGAADKGNAYAQYKTGEFFEASKSVNTAIEYYRKAAAQGNKDAQQALKRLSGN